MSERDAAAETSEPPEATEEEAPASEPAGSDDAGEPAAKAAAAADPFAEARGTWGFPAFAQDFPHDAELAALVSAYAAGDYATVRTGAPALAAKTASDEVKRAALLLRARIEPDPSSRLFFGLTAALLLFLFAWWATHDGPSHAAPAGPKPPPAVERVN